MGVGSLGHGHLSDLVGAFWARLAFFIHLTAIPLCNDERNPAGPSDPQLGKDHTSLAGKTQIACSPGGPLDRGGHRKGGFYR